MRPWPGPALYVHICGSTFSQRQHNISLIKKKTQRNKEYDDKMNMSDVK